MLSVVMLIDVMLSVLSLSLQLVFPDMVFI